MVDTIKAQLSFALGMDVQVSHENEMCRIIILSDQCEYCHRSWGATSDYALEWVETKSNATSAICRDAVKIMEQAKETICTCGMSKFNGEKLVSVH